MCGVVRSRSGESVYSVNDTKNATEASKMHHDAGIVAQAELERVKT